MEDVAVQGGTAKSADHFTVKAVGAYTFLPSRVGDGSTELAGMNEEVDCDVIIVGAGPTGLTLACCLARQGVSLRIVDAAAEPPRSSRGKGLQPRSLELFDDLGVLDPVLRNGSTLR